MSTAKKKPKAVTTRRRAAKHGAAKANALETLRDAVGQDVDFAMLIRSTREAEEWSQVDMAEQLGISKAHLCDLEKGRRTVSAARAAEFAEKLGYSPEYWVQVALQDQIASAGLNMSVVVRG